MENKMNYTSEELMDNITETELEPWMQLTTEGWDVPVGEIKEMNTVIDGVDTDYRVFVPENKADKMPLFFYIHGGAYVGGFNVMDEPVCRKVCNEVECVVISPVASLTDDNAAAVVKAVIIILIMNETVH